MVPRSISVKAQSAKLNTDETFYGSHRIFWCNSSTTRPHTCQHRAEITQSHTFAVLIRLSTATHNLQNYHQITWKNSAYWQINTSWLSSCTSHILVPGCTVTRLADKHRPCFHTRSKFVGNFALALFIWLLKACSRGQRPSGHLRKANNIVPFCLNQDQGDWSVKPNETRIPFDIGGCRLCESC